MIKAIIETFTWAAIVIGIIVTPVAAYVALNGSVHDGSIPHGALWHVVFGSSD